MAKRIIKTEPTDTAAGKASRRPRKPRNTIEPVVITEDQWKHHPHGPIPLTQDVYDSFLSWCPLRSRPQLYSTHPWPPLKARVGFRLDTTWRVVSDLCREIGQKGVLVLEHMSIQLGSHSPDHFLLCAILTHLGQATPKPHVFRKLMHTSTSPRCALDPQGSPQAWGIAESRVAAALDAHRQLTVSAWQTGAHETSQLHFYSQHVALCRKSDELEHLRKTLRLTGQSEERLRTRSQITLVEVELSTLTQQSIDRTALSPHFTCRRLCEVNWCVGDLP